MTLILKPEKPTFKVRFEIWAQREGEEHWKREPKHYAKWSEAKKAMEKLRGMSAVTKRMKWRVYRCETGTRRERIN